MNHIENKNLTVLDWIFLIIVTLFILIALLPQIFKSLFSTFKRAKKNDVTYTLEEIRENFYFRDCCGSAVLEQRMGPFEDKNVGFKPLNWVDPDIQSKAEKDFAERMKDALNSKGI